MWRVGREPPPSIAAVPPLSEPTLEVYRGMVDVAPDAMIAVDAETGVIRLVNAQAGAVFGYPRDELVGQPVEMLIPEWRRDVHRAHRAGYAAEPTARRMGHPGDDLRAVRRDGTELPVEVSLAPLPAVGEVRLVAAAIRDVSERRAIQEASERMRDELIATVSHELRTPLTSILGYTEILVDMGEEALSEQAARLLAIVRRNAERELKLVEDLLTLAFLGTSGLVVQPEPIDVAPVVRAVLEDLATMADEAGVELVYGGLDSLRVSGDAPRLSQVLSNLVTNAVKFTPRGGRVDVRLLVEGNHGVLEVEDQGMGVAAEDLPLVFDRMYRAPEVVAAQLPGAGLGLPIVKGIVDAHEGAIDVESEPGIGTRVHVRLPLAD